MTDLNLEKFNPAQAKPHRIWLIIGTRGSGKSVLLKDLLYNTSGAYDYGMAMTATHSSAETLRQIFPPSLVYDQGYDFDKADTMLV
jgi:type II secretory pathway predicted ATPase ExeA